MRTEKPHTAMTEGRYTIYPPSILVIEDTPCQAPKLKPGLENNGCRVHQIGTCVEELSAVQHKFFDLIVFNTKLCDVDSCVACQRLETDPELSGVPAVILATYGLPGEVIGKLRTSPIYYLAKDAFAVGRLLQIIEQIQYLTYRYQ